VRTFSFNFFKNLNYLKLKMRESTQLLWTLIKHDIIFLNSTNFTNLYRYKFLVNFLQKFKLFENKNGRINTIIVDIKHDIIFLNQFDENNDIKYKMLENSLLL
jgi:hypothetical protein